jgi:hypothetical protein
MMMDAVRMVMAERRVRWSIMANSFVVEECDLDLTWP